MRGLIGRVHHNLHNRLNVLGWFFFLDRIQPHHLCKPVRRRDHLGQVARVAALAPSLGAGRRAVGRFGNGLLDGIAQGLLEAAERQPLGFLQGRQLLADQVLSADFQDLIKPVGFISQPFGNGLVADTNTASDHRLRHSLRAK